jgi:hypothetical protein
MIRDIRCRDDACDVRPCLKEAALAADGRALHI